MIKNVLLVDDDREMLVDLREGFAKYAKSFSVLLAADGFEALENLDRQRVSLVVTDLKMPRMDGFELLAAIRDKYPDIPVVIITGFGTPDMERLARQAGAVAFTAKPFLIESLASQIITILGKETEGGTLHDVSTGMFLQLIEMEQKTCTIRLEDRMSGQRGALFFVDGVLLDARVGGMQREAAAYEIFAWDHASISIQNDCSVRENRIGKDLRVIIIEATRRKDEMMSPRSDSSGPGPTAQKAFTEPEALQRIRSKIEHELGDHCGVEFVFQDTSWTERLKRISRHGEKLQLGKLVTGYIDRGGSHNHIVIAENPPTVLAVSPKCPRDQILRLLSG